MSSGHVVTLGECLGSLVASTVGPADRSSGFTLFAAGAEANVAVGLARQGFSCSFLGLVGDDPPGRFIRAQLRAEGVDVSGLLVSPDRRTGLMLRELRGFGPNEVTYWRTGSAGAALAVEHLDAAPSVIESAAWLHVSGISCAISPGAGAAVERAVDLARASGVPVSLDINYRARLWSTAEAAAILRPLVPRCDVVFGSCEEVALLVPGGDAETLARGLLEAGARTAVLKLGADGALSAGADGVITRRTAHPVEPVDAVGAGDAFVAGYLAARLTGRSEEDALSAGNACGAFAVTSIGDQTGLPNRVELERVLTSDAIPDVVR